MAQVKDGRNKLDSKFAAQADLIADLKKRLQTSQADKAALEDEFNKNRAKTAQLQLQIEELKSKTLAGPKKPADFDTLPKPSSDVQYPEAEAKSPNPADIIDWVIKKKSQ